MVQELGYVGLLMSLKYRTGNLGNIDAGLHGKGVLITFSAAENIASFLEENNSFILPLLRLTCGLSKVQQEQLPSGDLLQSISQKYRVGCDLGVMGPGRSKDIALNLIQLLGTHSRGLTSSRLAAFQWACFSS